MKNSLSNISFAVFLIFFGLVALLVSCNYVAWNDLFSLFIHFWPLLVIVAGLKIIVGVLPYGSYINLAIDIAFNILIVFSLLFFNRIESKIGNNFSWINNNTPVIKEFSGLDVLGSSFNSSEINEKNYQFDIGASHFTLTDLDSPDYLTVTGKYNSSMFVPQISSGVMDKNLKVHFYQAGVQKMGMWRWNTGQNDFVFNIGQKTIPTNIDLNLGAGNGEVTLNQTVLKSVTADVGAGNLSLNLKSLPTKLVHLNVGAGNITLILPKGTDYTLKYNVGLGNVKVMEGEKTLKEFGGIAAKGEYGSGNFKIEVSAGAGNVDVVFE